MSDMRTPSKRVGGLGSARTGTTLFRAQRLTAMANVPLSLFLLVSVLVLTGADYQTVRGYLANPIVAIALLLLIASSTWHMCLGMQVIIEDYIYGPNAKSALLGANFIFSAVIALACAYAILLIGLNP